MRRGIGRIDIAQGEYVYFMDVDDEIRCLSGHGFRYTLRRILFGRQEKE